MKSGETEDLTDKVEEAEFLNEIGTAPKFTGEPIYSQMDHNIQQTIINRCVDYGVKNNPETGINELYIKEERYPDLLDAGNILLSHLEGTTYYIPDTAERIFRRFKLWCMKKKGKYRRNREAMNLLDLMKQAKQRQILGDAMMGKRQDFTVRMSGSTRRLEVERTGSKGKSLIDRLRGA